LQVNDILGKQRFITQVIAYVKYKGSNSSSMTTALTSVILCQALTTPFVWACWGHAMSNVVNMPPMITMFLQN
jgi:acetoacetate decarboxylase